MGTRTKNGKKRSADLHVRFNDKNFDLYEYLEMQANDKFITEAKAVLLIIAEHKQFKRPPL